MSNNLEIITSDIYNTRASFTAALTDTSINFDSEAGFAIQVIQQSDYLLKAAMNDRQAVVNAVNNIAAIGISLNPAKKQAYLVPRKVRGSLRVCLDVSYIGLMDLAVATGSIRWGQARLVHENDAFEMRGFDQEPEHRYNPFSKNRGPVVGVYVVVKTADGDYLTEPMSIDEVHEIRDRSEAWKAYKADNTKTNPWLTDPGEMIKKTVVKRAYKYWPKTERLNEAIHHLNTDGGEGVALASGVPVFDPDKLAYLMQQVQNAADADAVAAVWKRGLDAIKEASQNGKYDKRAYDAFKDAVAARGAALRGEAVPTHTPPDDGKTIDEAPATTAPEDDGFGRDYNRSE
ncbi:MAG: recombinase RecT [Achromobacter sp.]|uniref:recombinase RecT n=1 Tax=Achromobacter sp. TaxID=134375 RepID=UPI003D06F735